jgi:hypothetical protein
MVESSSMRKVEGDHICTGLLVASGLVSIWLGGTYRDQANHECQPVIPSGQTEWVCSDYNAIGDGNTRDVLNDVGFMAFGAAGMLVLVNSLKKSKP